MEPFPGPGQCSLHSSLGAAGGGGWGWRGALSGWGGRMQTAGSQVAWSQEVLSPPHPHACPHACAHTGLSARAEVFTRVRRCGSKCLCQMHHQLCARLSVEHALEKRGSSAKPSPFPPAPSSSLWGWRSRTDGGGVLPHPLLLGSTSWSSVLRTPL